MERGRSLLIFKVKFQGHWAFTKNSGTWILVDRIYQELYSLGCSNLVCILNMERERNLLIFKVKGQIPWSLGLYKEFWHLDPCGQDIARTIWPRMLKFSVYTLYGQRKKPINIQGQRSHFNVTGPLQRILALGSLWAGYSKNYLA